MDTIEFRAWVPQTMGGDLLLMSWDDLKGYDYKKRNYFMEALKLGDSIIEQYTGLKDKNGKKIFEGDVLQFSDRTEWYRNDIIRAAIRGVSIHDEVRNNLEKYPNETRAVKLPEGYDWLLSPEIQVYWEIIGNIHENPELLGKGNK